jgi:hypothetical protein
MPDEDFRAALRQVAEALGHEQAFSHHGRLDI